VSVKTVWKFSVPLGAIGADVIEIEMPQSAEILSVQNQDENLCVWALVDPHGAKDVRCLRVAGTGHVVPAQSAAFLGTVQFHFGRLVLHVFDNGWKRGVL
jgi:hypothetical protein